MSRNFDNIKDPEQRIVNARIQMLMKQPFFGTLATRLKVKDASLWVPTMGTDGMYLYYNKDWVMKLDKDELIFVLAHEVYHCVFEHFTRRGSRDARLWNIACDYAINWEIAENKVGKVPTWKENAPWPGGPKKGETMGLLDYKYKAMTADEIYDILAKEMQKNSKSQDGKDSHDVHIEGKAGGKSQASGAGMKPQDQQSCGSCGGQVDKDGKALQPAEQQSGSGQGGEDEQDGGSGGQQQDSGQNGEQGQDGTGGANGEQGQEQGDGGSGDHQHGDGHGDGRIDDTHVCPSCGGQNDGTNGPAQMTESQRRQLQDDFRHAVIQAAKAASGSGAGSLPLGVKRLIDEFTEPQMDWREFLEADVQSCLKSDFSFQRPSRKSWHTGCSLPGMLEDVRIEVDVAIDTSGSMSERMLRDLMGEVKGIMEQFADFKLRAWCFDTQTYTVHEYGPENLEEIYDFQMEGGGGTLFECNWEMMKENDIEPNRLIVMTDGYPCGTWGDPLYCDTIFLVHGSKDIEAPFGTTLYYDGPND